MRKLAEYGMAVAFIWAGWLLADGHFWWSMLPSIGGWLLLDARDHL